MIFGIRIADDALNGPGFDAILKLNHWEAFTLLVIYTHGRGGDPRKRRFGRDSQIGRLRLRHKSCCDGKCAD